MKSGDIDKALGIGIPKDLITVKEAARLVNNTHQNTVRRWIHKGKLPAYHLAGCKNFLVSRADVLALLQPHAEPVKVQFETRAEKSRRQREAERILREQGVG